MTETDGPAAERKLITHARVGKLIDLPGDVVEAAAMSGLVAECVEHRGQWYMFDPAVLPEREKLIATLRGSYRSKLREIDEAANAVLAEVEAVQDDARDALEHGTDPVGDFGDDLSMMIELRRTTDLQRRLDHLRNITFDARLLHRCLHIVDHPDPMTDPRGYGLDPLPPPRPRRAERRQQQQRSQSRPQS